MLNQEIIKSEEIVEKPKVIFIDWNKTLSASHFWRNLPDVETVMFLANRHLLMPWMRGQSTAEEICQVLSGQTGVSYDLIFNELKDSCANMEFVDSRLPELIAKIRSNGVKVVLATDNMDCFVRFTAPALQLNNLFDDILVSCNLKILKNDVQGNSIPFFEDYFKRNNLSYNEVVLLDDSAEMGKAYRQLGLPVVVINNRERLLEVLGGYAEDNYDYE
jgi:FMN phosphatase YigB (HAD superfamily)